MQNQEIERTRIVQRNIVNTIRALALLPKTYMEIETPVSSQGDPKGNYWVFWVKNKQEYVPDFKFVWCGVKKHYRIYIHIAHTEYNKQNAGYCICTISNAFVAAMFVSLYSFLHKHRANNKEAALA